MVSRADSGFQDTLTVCPFCSCGCGLHLQGRGNALTGVIPSEMHPVSRGTLCARGWSAHEASRWGARLLHPQVRANGALRRATWDDALAAAVFALDRLRHDGRAVGVIGSGRATNEENFLAVSLARSALRTGRVDAALGESYQSLLPPHGATGASLLALEQLERADLVFVLEDDLAASHPRVATSVLRALQRGGRLITIGWHRTALSGLAAEHMMLSATDPAGTLRALGESDAAALLAGALRPAFVLAPFDADSALVAECSRAVRSLAATLAREDGEPPLVLALPVRANTRGALEMGVTPNALPGRAPLDDPEARERLRALWHGAPCWDAGNSAEEMLGHVSGLVVVADDPSATHSHPARAVAAMRALDTLIVLDSFDTPATQAAHVVLPIAAFGETVGSVMNFAGSLQRMEACVAPRGDARPGWQVLRDLLAGLGAAFVPDSLEAVQRAIRVAVPERSHQTVRAMPAERASRERADEAAPSGWVLRRAGAFDWGDDVLVTSSPILRRSTVAERRQHPDGVVWMHADDAAELGVKDGWRVRITSAVGEVEVPVAVRGDQSRGVLLAPFSHRDRLAAVLGDAGVQHVEVSRT
ncbi:MAG: molybdopterin-dependent oxidoreductase [Gemmatimonadaceae bacterium]|nr:molybdopterin-dependent oxidoreductase [Gemmatimonadaceae bacterium]